MSDISLLEKVEKFHKKYCYQYQRRLDTIEEDKKNLNLTDDDIANIKLDDITFHILTTKEEKQEATDFIKRYEWMGTVGSFPTHWFGARWNDVLVGVIIMSMPNAFSKLLGEQTKNIERLIARGASHSIAPKNLGSKFLMWSIKWMVNNTPYRLFTCYSDPQCAELGSIYQGLNFYYLGQKSGTTTRCINPYNPEKVISDRAFRARSFYKRYCHDLGIEIQPNWFGDQTVHWENIPDDIEKQLREYSKEMYKNAKKIEFPNKHKYAFVIGKDKRETKALRQEFLERNKVYEYPKERAK